MQAKLQVPAATIPNAGITVNQYIANMQKPLSYDADGQGCRNCGRQRKYIGSIGEKKYYSRYCPECSRIKSEIDKKKQVREKRIEKLNLLKKRVSRVLCKRYAKSHIRTLSKPLRDEFLSLGSSGSLFMLGQVGCGKTWALHSFARYWVCRKKRVEFWRYEDLLCEIRKGYSGDGKNESVLLDRIKSCEILMIDDLGTTASSSESDFSLRILFNVIDYRHNNMLASYIASNKTINEIKSSFDSRIASRLAGIMKVLNLEGKDLRQSVAV